MPSKLVKEKKHFLVIWPTIRRDWVSTFYKLEDQFRFTFIPSTFPQEPNFADCFECRYWSEFSSVQQLLDEVKPDGVIFMSIESGLSMATNYLAQKRGIRTIILQHGIFTNYKDYRNREKLWRKNNLARETKDSQVQKGFSTLRFLKKSLIGTDRFKLLSIAIYTKLQQKVGPYWAAKHLPLSIKKANQYICYSPFNATIHRETDRVSEHEISYVGSHELMNYLKKEEPLTDKPFYLHIDQALAQNSFGEETVSREAMIGFYQKLNDYCLSQQASLYIKLHPESYKSDWLPKHDNIHYIRHVDNFNQIIQSALGCFGFYSTMVIPAVYWKPTILFKITYSGLQEELGKMGAAQILDFHDFQFSQFSFQKFENPQLIKTYFIQPEGVCEDSLANRLNEPT
ncbi:polysialyltransferase family glycosyltransferase [Roseivirga thermotolerans]|uniref:polysialyltransferase family glycosyltransferase n=1 Tax=Roseivirga thermotolerans TaxID=1758176 RepID=UPI00273FFC3B|nr:polysialyltransferase family glycosyltransferase [Roseivirga thermotolerans]